MSRIQTNRLGYTGFECNCNLPVGCWEPPEYNPMNGEGALCDDLLTLNRYLNIPRKLEGETAEAHKYENFGLQAVKDALALVYVPSGLVPDPVGGNYINLYQICSDNGMGAIFDTECFPLNVCEPSEYTPGYLNPPVPFISFQPVPPGGGGGGSDPGMEGITAITGLSFRLDPTELCLAVTETTWDRDPGVREVNSAVAYPYDVCADVTDCPPELTP